MAPGGFERGSKYRSSQQQERLEKIGPARLEVHDGGAPEISKDSAASPIIPEEDIPRPQSIHLDDSYERLKISELHLEARNRLGELERVIYKHLSVLEKEEVEAQDFLSRLQKLVKTAIEWVGFAQTKRENLQNILEYIEDLNKQLDVQSAAYVESVLLPYIRDFVRTQFAEQQLQPETVESNRAAHNDFTNREWDFFLDGDESRIHLDRVHQCDQDVEMNLGYPDALEEFVSVPDDRGEVALQQEIASQNIHSSLKILPSEGEKRFVRQEEMIFRFAAVEDYFSDNLEVQADAFARLQESVFQMGKKSYRVIGEIARGGVGAALLARDEETGKEFVLKLTKPNRRSEKASIEGGASARFQIAEIAAQSRLTRMKDRIEGESMSYFPIAEYQSAMQYSHPEDKDRVITALLMERIEGKTLYKKIREGMTHGEGVQIAQELIQAVEYMHEQGVLHRDLKSSNVMIQKETGHVKIIDFGLSLIPKALQTQAMKLKGVERSREVTLEGGNIGVRAGESVSHWERVDTRIDSRTGKPSSPNTWALPEVGCFVGTPQYVPDMELRYEGVRSTIEGLHSPAEDPGLLAHRLMQIGANRDIYALGMMLCDVARAMKKREVQMTAEEQADAAVLFWLGARIIRGHEEYIPGEDDVSFEEMKRVMTHLRDPTILTEVQKISTIRFLEETAAHILTKRRNFKLDERGSVDRDVIYRQVPLLYESFGDAQTRESDDPILAEVEYESSQNFLLDSLIPEKVDKQPLSVQNRGAHSRDLNFQPPAMSPLDVPEPGFVKPVDFSDNLSEPVQDNTMPMGTPLSSGARSASSQSEKRKN